MDHKINYRKKAERKFNEWGRRVLDRAVINIMQKSEMTLDEHLDWIEKELELSIWGDCSSDEHKILPSDIQWLINELRARSWVDDCVHYNEIG